VRVPAKARLAAAAALGLGRSVSARITIVAAADSLETRKRRSVKLTGGVSRGG
jgi:hypothetical protein